MRVQIQNLRYPVWVLWLVGVPIAVAAIALVVFFFTFFLIVFAFAALVFALRIWWLRRKLRRAPPRSIIEGEYVVLRGPQRTTDPE